jgi:hypothetical protein
MAKTGQSGRTTRGEVKTVDLSGLLTALAPQKLETKELNEQLKEIVLETKLLSLADIAIERETEGLREVLSALGKL